MELIPCACVLIPLIGLGAWLAFVPLFRRAALPQRDGASRSQRKA